MTRCFICNEELGDRFYLFALLDSETFECDDVHELCGTCYAHINQAVRNLKLMCSNLKDLEGTIK